MDEVTYANGHLILTEKPGKQQTQIQEKHLQQMALFKLDVWI